MKLFALCSLIVLLVAGCTFQLPWEHPTPPPTPPGPIEPANSPPIALFSISHRIPYTDQAVIFDATASRDYDGWIVGYCWNLGPAGVQTAPAVVVTFEAAGEFPVWLVVTDNEGATGIKSYKLTVQSKSQTCFNGICE